jgi:hypothetical protein
MDGLLTVQKQDISDAPAPVDGFFGRSVFPLLLVGDKGKCNLAVGQRNPRQNPTPVSSRLGFGGYGYTEAY